MQSMAPLPEPERAKYLFARKNNEPATLRSEVEEVVRRLLQLNFAQLEWFKKQIKEHVPVTPEGLSAAPGVEENLYRFAEQASWLQLAGLNHHPCVSSPTGDPVPVKLGAAAASFVQAAFEREMNTLEPVLGSAFEASAAGAAVVPVPIEEARESFLGKASQFLSSWLNHNVPNKPGFPYPFQVETFTIGLRVHYSDAYFYDPFQILSAPSSPVMGYLLPGIYIFGASRLGQAPVFDHTAEYEVPETRFASLPL